jgi:peptide/nickel transport system permease protein
MGRYLVERLVHAAAVLLGVTSLVFGLLHLSGDPLSGLAPPGSSPAQEALIRRRYELDRPLITQYANFLGRAVRGDFGESWRQRRPAMDAVLERLPASAALALGATGLALLVGVPLGIVAGARTGGLIDAAARTVAVLGQALPGFWLGSLLILLFAVRLHWLPSSGGDGPRALVLPVITLAAYPTATVARLLRSSLREQLTQDYIRTARGKGLPRRAVVGHGLRNAVLPTLAFVGLQVGFLLGGAVVVEVVFAYPGIGRLALDAVADRDVPLIQAFVVVVAVLIVLTNELVDLVARLLDPRLRSPIERRSVGRVVG